jgi:hypothetical protein
MTCEEADGRRSNPDTPPIPAALLDCFAATRLAMTDFPVSTQAFV